MPHVSFPPILHELSEPNAPHESVMEYIHGGELYGGSKGNWGEITTLDPPGVAQPMAIAAVGFSSGELHSGRKTSSWGWLPLQLPDGAKLNSLSVMGYSPWDTTFELFSQSLTYPIAPSDVAQKEGRTVQLAETTVGASTVRTERGLRVIGDPYYNRKVVIWGDSGPVTVDNEKNWYGLWVRMRGTYPESLRGYFTGVRITYDEPIQIEVPEGVREIPQELNDRTKLTVIGSDQSVVGVVLGGDLVELESSGTGTTTFTLLPGEYEILTDGEEVEIVTDPAPAESEVPDWLSMDPGQRGDDDNPTAR